MRILCLLALLGLTACDWFGSPAPPPPNVPAIQTETAALQALATAKAMAFPPTPTAGPPAEQTRIAVGYELIDLLSAGLHAQNTATVLAIQATMTALPRP